MKGMQFRCERPVFYQSRNVAVISLSKMTQLNGSNYALKVRASSKFRSSSSIFNIFISFTEPFDRSNTARSCCDEKIFERIKKVFNESWHLLEETKDLDRLFSEPLAPPAFCTFYDNYTPILYHHQPMDYILR